MNAIEILMEEHESILTMIDISQNILSEENMDNLPINDLEKLIDFIQNFADKYHHLKEEDILFQEMVNRGMSNENGPISVMLHEHNLGRTYIKHAIEGIKKFKSGNKPLFNKSEITFLHMVRCLPITFIRKITFYIQWQQIY